MGSIGTVFGDIEIVNLVILKEKLFSLSMYIW